MLWWDRWAQLDKEYSPTPYSQLAAVLTAYGDRDAANQIRYLGRERERDDAWYYGRYGTWLYLTFLKMFVGYGIGPYNFIAPCLWIAILSTIGAMFLWQLPEARTENRTWWWSLGASFSRMLPVEINKEFTNFFDGPFRPRFDGWQTTMLYTLRIVGWVLAATILAAFAGLTQGP